MAANIPAHYHVLSCNALWGALIRVGVLYLGALKNSKGRYVVEGVC